MTTDTTITFKCTFNECIYDSQSDYNFKINICNSLLETHFSSIEKNDYKKIGDFDFYINCYFHKITDFHYTCRSIFYNYFHIIFDEKDQNKFIIGLSGCYSPNDDYRKYIFVEKEKDKYIYKTISSNNHSSIWNFDNRNTYYEKLIDNKLYIIVFHRDNFEGNCKIYIHNISDSNTKIYTCNDRLYRFSTEPIITDEIILYGRYKVIYE